MQPTVLYLKKQFDKYNKEFFNNELPEIKIEISRTKDALGQFRYVSRTKTPVAIRISKYYDRNAFEIDQTLVHEMIHYYICLNKIKDTSSHGVVFTRMANEINNKSNFNITATTLNTAPISRNKTYRIFCFTYKGRKCYARICSNFDYKWFAKEYKFEDVCIVTTQIAAFDNWVECRSRLRWYYENDLTKKLNAA